jgi:hypothetical protein
LIKAKSTDVEAVKDIIFKGMEYDGPQGRYKMIARPDFGFPDRSVDSISNSTFQKVVNGKMQQVGDEVGWNETLGYCVTGLGWSSIADAVPPGGVPVPSGR